jgi:hypothetical protein
MPADAAAIPPNPKTAATSAMMRNITAQPNISSPPPRLNRICRLYRAPIKVALIRAQPATSARIYFLNEIV